MRPSRSTWGLAACSLSVLLSLPALGGERAAPAPTPAAAPTQDAAATAEQAALFYERAVQAYGRQSYQASIDALGESLRLRPSPAARLMLAHCYRHLGKLGSAYGLYRQVIEEVETLAKSGDTNYQPVLSAAYRNIAQLDPLVPRLTLDVPPEVPPDYTVTLDGVEQPRLQWGVTQTLDPGVHEVVGSRVGKAEVTERVDLKPGDRRRINLRPVRPATALLRLGLEEGPPDLAVRLDGRELPKGTREAPLYLDPGRHSVVVTAPGYRRFTWERILRDREQARVDVLLEAKFSTPRWLFFTTAGLTLGAVAAGVGLGVVAQQREVAALRDKPEESQRSTAERDQIKTLATAANACFGVAAVLGTTSLVLGFTTRWRTVRARKPSPLQPVLAVAPGSLLVSGVF